MAAWEFQALQNIAEKNGWHKFISMQNYYNLLYREEGICALATKNLSVNVANSSNRTRNDPILPRCGYWLDPLVSHRSRGTRPAI